MSRSDQASNTRIPTATTDKKRCAHDEAALGAAGDDESNERRSLRPLEQQQKQQQQQQRQKFSQDKRQLPQQQQQQLWFREWELTWPIWHMLSRDDRRSLAQQHGYKTIGEFEEFMTLQRAVGDSTDLAPYDNELAYPHNSNANTDNRQEQQQQQDSGPSRSNPSSSSPKNPKKCAKKEDEDDEEEGFQDDSPMLLERKTSTVSTSTTNSTTELSLEELLERGGQILMLPDELLHTIFSYLPVDAYGALALVSPHWKHVTRTEAVYRRLCERLYLHQCQRKTLQVSKFGNSYRTMLEQRPRVRAGGGVYVLKYCEVKPIQRDMWTEIPVGAVLESIYYRYLYFQEDGRVLYALTSLPPSDIFRRFYKMGLHRSESQQGHHHHNHHHQQQQQQQQQPHHHNHHHHNHHNQHDQQQHFEDNVAVWGTFSVKRNQVTVTAKQAWHTVRLQLRIIQQHQQQQHDDDDGDDNHHGHGHGRRHRHRSPYGRFGMLTLERHLSSVSGCFDERSRDLVEYKVPPEVFQFVKDKIL